MDPLTAFLVGLLWAVSLAIVFRVAYEDGKKNGRPNQALQERIVYLENIMERSGVQLTRSIEVSEERFGSWFGEDAPSEYEPERPKGTIPRWDEKTAKK